MKRLVTVLIAITLFTPLAKAGLFDIWSVQPASLMSLFSKKNWVDSVRSNFSDVPVTTDCEPRPVPGAGEVFRWTKYCHRANPQAASGFLLKGFDVPATFLTSFTEAETIARWKNSQFVVSGFMGAVTEVPSVLLKSLNISAARAWEEILACAGGDGDLAREMYRTGEFSCPGQGDKIFARLKELHVSVASLGSSTGVDLSRDSRSITERIVQNSRVDRQFRENAPQLDDESRRRGLEALKSQREDLINQMFRMDRSEVLDVVELLEKNRQSISGLHPLLIEIMLEEVLSVVSLEERVFWTARGLKKSPEKLTKLIQLLNWIGSIEDGGCSSLGLWPSANRVAIATLFDRTVEVWNEFDAPKRQSVRGFEMIACAEGRAPRAGGTKIGHSDIVPEELLKAVRRLGGVYDAGAKSIWRELQEVRERYAQREPK